MSWGAVIAGGAAILGGVIGSQGAKSAAGSQTAAANNATAAQLQMYNQTRADQTPWRTAGGAAVNALSNWYGLGGLPAAQPTAAATGPQKKPNYGGSLVGQAISGAYNAAQAPYNAVPPNTAPSAATQMQTIANTPGYQWQLSQGTQAVQRNLAAKGLLNSGAAGKALEQYGQGLAGTYESQYVSGLQSLAGLGQGAANSVAAAGMNAANQVGSNQIYAGNAQAYGAIGQGQAIVQGIQGLAGIAGDYFRVPTYTNDPSSQYYTPYANAATSMNLGIN